MDDLGKHNGTSSILHQTLCIISNPSVNSNWSKSPETLNLGRNRHFFYPVTLKFDGWPWKTIWHLFYTMLSFVHHFQATSELKLELQSGNAQFWSKSVIFCPLWPWNLMDDLKNNRAPLLCCFKLCSSFHSHHWIQTGVTVWKRPIWVKIDDFFLAVWPWNLMDDLKKAIGQLS